MCTYTTLQRYIKKTLTPNNISENTLTPRDYHPFDAARDGGENFVRDRTEDGGKLRSGRVFTEYGHRVTHLRIDTGDIEHAHVHADVSDGRHSVSVQRKSGGSPAEAAVDAVGISDRDRGYHCSCGSYLTVPAVAYRAVLGHQMLYLQYLAFERCYGGELHIRQGTDAVDADAQTHHVELVFRETLYSSGIQDMEHGPVAERFHQQVGIGPEHGNLSESESVVLRLFCRRQMRINRLDPDKTAVLEIIGKRSELTCHETEPVHPRIELDMYRIVFDSPVFQHPAKSIEGLDVRDARLQGIVYYLVEKIRSSRQYQDRGLDTGLTQLYAFHRICYGK